MEWKKVKLNEVLSYEQPTKYIVSSVDYNDNNTTPVLTAGKTFILGYTNEKNGVFQEKLPVIIFDDFTTAVQFVDFPFKVKSSAMKILHADTKKAYIKYLFYAMQGIEFPVRKHKRHWISEYSNIEISLPPIDEQKRIADKLDAIFIDIEKGFQYIEKMKDTSEKMFENTLRVVFENSQKNWKKTTLKNVLTFNNGKAHEGNINKNGKYILINSKFVASDGLKYKRTDKAFSPLTNGDIVMVMSDVPNGKALAKCFIVDKDDTYTLNQRICSLRPFEKSDIRFFYYQLNRNTFLLSFNNGQRQTNLRKDDILECPIFVPELSEQKRIVDELDLIKKLSAELSQKAKKQVDNFTKLKQSILSQSFQTQK